MAVPRHPTAKPRNIDISFQIITNHDHVEHQEIFRATRTSTSSAWTWQTVTEITDNLLPTFYDPYRLAVRVLKSMKNHRKWKGPGHVWEIAITRLLGNGVDAAVEDAFAVITSANLWLMLIRNAMELVCIEMQKEDITQRVSHD